MKSKELLKISGSGTLIKNVFDGEYKRDDIHFGALREEYGSTIGIFPDADKSFGIAVGGQIGIDYELPIPLQLSLDARPMWNFLGAYNGFGWGACLGIRYMF